MDIDQDMRAEEGYDIIYYNLDQLNWICTLWSALLCYGGPWLLPLFGALLGWAVAPLDLWIWRTGTVTAFVTGIWIGSIPMFFEWGFAGILGNLRGLLVLIVIIRILGFLRKPIAGKWSGRQQMGPSPSTLPRRLNSLSGENCPCSH